MSGTPIFEQLCREHAEAGKAHPENVAEPGAAEQEAPESEEEPAEGGREAGGWSVPGERVA